MGLRSMASASASRRRGSCALELGEKTSASNSTGSDNADDVPFRCAPLAACDAVSMMSALSSSSAMAWSRRDLPNSISTASTKGRPAQLSSFAASLSSFAGCHSATWKGPVPMGRPLPLRLSRRLRGNASSASSEGVAVSLSIEMESADARTFQPGWSASRIGATAAGDAKLPSWNFTPRRSVNCQWRALGSLCHAAASAGCGRPCASRVTSVSPIRERVRAMSQ